MLETKKGMLFSPLDMTGGGFRKPCSESPDDCQGSRNLTLKDNVILTSLMIRRFPTVQESLKENPAMGSVYSRLEERFDRLDVLEFGNRNTNIQRAFLRAGNALLDQVASTPDSPYPNRASRLGTDESRFGQWLVSTHREEFLSAFEGFLNNGDMTKGMPPDQQRQARSLLEQLRRRSSRSSR